MACWGIICGFLMRVCLSIVMTQLVLPVKKSTNSTKEVCPASEGTTQPGAVSTKYKKGYFKRKKNKTTSSIHYYFQNTGYIDWNEEVQARIFSSFYVGYIITHVPAGILADKFGGKWVLGIGVFIITISTFLCPYVIGTESAYGLIGLRVTKGLGSGPMFPATTVLLSHWIPISHRSKVGTIVLGGCQFGTVLANGISGLLLREFHWSVVFYSFATVSVVWLLFYVRIYRFENDVS